MADGTNHANAHNWTKSKWTASGRGYSRLWYLRWAQHRNGEIAQMMALPSRDRAPSAADVNWWLLLRLQALICTMQVDSQTGRRKSIRGCVFFSFLAASFFFFLLSFSVSVEIFREDQSPWQGSDKVFNNWISVAIIANGKMFSNAPLDNPRPVPGVGTFKFVLVVDSFQWSGRSQSSGALERVVALSKGRQIVD